jgi:hypothetical protein
MTEQQPAGGKAAELCAILVKQDARSIRGSLGRFLLGLGWCILAVLVWATFFTLLLNALFGGSGIGWTGWFFLGALLLAALIVLLERRVRAAESAGVPPVQGAAPAGAEDYAIPAPGGSLGQKLVWGPPAVLSGFRGVRGNRTRRQEAVFGRAVVLVFDLARQPGSNPIKAVVHPPEDLSIFGSAVDWLEAHDWIGQSTDKTALFLSTLGQKRLVENNLMR